MGKYHQRNYTKVWHCEMKRERERWDGWRGKSNMCKKVDTVSGTLRFGERRNKHGHCGLMFCGQVLLAYVEEKVCCNRNGRREWEREINCENVAIQIGERKSVYCCGLFFSKGCVQHKHDKKIFRSQNVSREKIVMSIFCHFYFFFH